MQANLTVREERIGDVASIRQVNESAFGGADEAHIVQALRKAGALTLSLVAEKGAQVVGHIAFSPVRIEAPETTRCAIGLAPMSVLPEEQSQGIGSLLVREGLAALRKRDHDAVVVLGHPEYYPRFGFVPAARFGLRCHFDCPAEAFMALNLKPAGLSGLAGGVVHYRSEFGGC